MIYDFSTRRPKRKPETFPFKQLPLLVKNEVIRSLQHKDCINLAVAAKKAAEAVQDAKIKAIVAIIHISSAANIELLKRERSLFPNVGCDYAETAGVIKMNELTKLINQSSDNVLENLSKVYHKLENIFCFERKPDLIFSTDHKKIATVKEVLSDPIMRNWRSCQFESETLDLEDLKLVLDMASPDRSFASKANEYPIDFRHENAFKFKNMYYKDARWVKMEDIYALKNCCDVVLGRTMFTQPEIKAFINHWVNSDFDMFWLLDVFTEEEFDTVDILDGLTLLHIEQADGVCLTMAKATETRKKTLLCFSNTENSLLLTAWAPGEFISGEGDKFDKAIRKREGVIELLIEKKQLETELESADEENKPNIPKRLNQLEDEIESYGVFFANGKATLRLPTL